MQESDTSTTAPALGVWRRIRRVFILIAGVTVVLIGVVLLVMPGPAMLVIPAGLAILATEFVWARRLLQRVKASAMSAAHAARGDREKAEDAADVSDASSRPRGLWQRCVRRVRHTYEAVIEPFRKGYVDDPPIKT